MFSSRILSRRYGRIVVIGNRWSRVIVMITRHPVVVRFSRYLLSSLAWRGPSANHYNDRTKPRTGLDRVSAFHEKSKDARQRICSCNPQTSETRVALSRWVPLNRHTFPPLLVSPRSSVVSYYNHIIPPGSSRQKTHYTTGVNCYYPSCCKHYEPGLHVHVRRLVCRSRCRVCDR